MSSKRKSFGARLVSRSALLAQVAAMCLVSSPALAAVIDSGPVSIPIPDNIDGVYFNIVTGASAGSPPPAGWDINPYSAAAGQFNLWGPTTQTWYSPGGTAAGPYPLPLGTVIQGAATTFFRPGGGTDIAPQVTLNSDQNFLGFRFANEANGGANHFGYIQVQFGATAGTRTIVRYAWEDVADTAITVTGGSVAPQFAYNPTAGSTVPFTGGTTIGSTGSASIAVTIGTAGSGTGAAATTTTTCTAPTAPFAGFGQTVTATGNGAISGSPLSGTCTLGAAQVTQTLTCSENRGGTAVPVTWTLDCPAGTALPLTSNPPSGSTITLPSQTAGGPPTTSTITFTNPGPTAATVTCTAPAAPFSASPLSIPVPANGGTGSTTVTLNSPTAGTFSGTLNCTAGTQTFTFTLGGTVLPAPVIPVPGLGDTGRMLLMLLLLGLGLAAVGVRRI